MFKKYMIWIVLTLLVVFALGAVAGYFGERYVIHRRPPAAGPQRPRFPSLDEFAKDLALTAEQKAKIGEIFKRNEERMKQLRTELHGRLRDIRSLLKNEIDSVLTPEQKQKLESLIQKHIEQSRRENPRGERSVQPDERKAPRERG
jgi:Spy/CpxP family protein refolding chaperone